MNKQEEKAFNTFHYQTNERYSIPPEETVYFPVWKRIVEILTNEETICEIGCGSGQLANLLIRNGKQYRQGFDYIPEAIGLAKRMNKGSEECFDVMDLDDMVALPKYDIYVCTEVLEHIEDDKRVIAMLPDNARIIFSVPNFKAVGHKRTFQSIGDIRKRYSNLEIIHYESFQINKKAVIHLIDAIK